MNKIDVDFNADRIIHAISKIGYSAPSAIEDILDNSVTAKATDIRVEFFKKEDYALSKKNNIDYIAIYDDGIGMSKEAAINALTLGGGGDYDSDSLSKYGFGLKSAGFSLGTKITIISKQNGKILEKAYSLDKEIYKEHGGDFFIMEEDHEEGDIEKFKEFIGEKSSGTLVLIKGCEKVVHHSIRSIINKLQYELGVIYFNFLKRNGLSINISVNEGENVRIAPFDMFFSDLSLEKGFDFDEYDCLTPLTVFNKDFSLKGYPDIEPVKMKVTIFPQDQMKRDIKFTPEQRRQVDSYKISRANRGFFVYRNERLIRWGDDLGTDVGRNDLGIRIELKLRTEHDDILNVDVSKQRMLLPEDVVEELSILLRVPLSNSRDAFRKCREVFTKDDKGESYEEGDQFNNANIDLVEEDPDQVEQTKPEETKKRTKKLKDQTKKELEEAGEESPGTGDIDSSDIVELPVFRKVRYSDKIKQGLVWNAGFDSKEDSTFVRINKNHSLYDTVLLPLSDSSNMKQVIEAILFNLSAAEVLTIQGLHDVDQEVIEKVILKFKKVFSYNLDNWCDRNQDLFEE